ncbi:uncharacterized protein LOC134540401 isoform X1 [Bacillus rossius redtenbacheri]|uniref:uncharacterized protein LOC134540401 isoform X1 n=1 Tax=Bacillus rossius redtenbacheri TaxID=93214 RepID=UPI002FDE3F82
MDPEDRSWPTALLLAVAVSVLLRTSGAAVSSNRGGGVDEAERGLGPAPVAATRRAAGADRLRFQRQPCSCQTRECGCCATILVQRFNFSQRGCLNLSVDPSNLSMKMKVYLNNKTVFQQQISGRNPPPICVPVPQFPLLMLCARLYDVRLEGNNVHACINLEAQLQGIPLLVVSFDCVRFGADGFAVEKTQAGEPLKVTSEGSPTTATEKLQGVGHFKVTSESTPTTANEKLQGVGHFKVTSESTPTTATTEKLQGAGHSKVTSESTPTTANEKPQAGEPLKVTSEGSPTTATEKLQGVGHFKVTSESTPTTATTEKLQGAGHTKVTSESTPTTANEKLQGAGHSKVTSESTPTTANEKLQGAGHFKVTSEDTPTTATEKLQGAGHSKVTSEGTPTTATEKPQTASYTKVTLAAYPTTTMKLGERRHGLRGNPAALSPVQT